MIKLKQRMGILKRIKKRVPIDKLIIIAEAIFNSKIRYGIAAYLIPNFEREDVKMEKLTKHAKELQVVQNSMVRVILGLKRANRVNMKEQRKKINMLSVNQMAVYHTVMEAYNITEKNASDQLQNKLKTHEGKHSERCAAKNDLFVPEKPRLKCIGFSYIGPKLFNMLPKNVKDAKTTDDFKTKLKKWIWDDIH